MKMHSKRLVCKGTSSKRRWGVARWVDMLHNRIVLCAGRTRPRRHKDQLVIGACTSWPPLSGELTNKQGRKAAAEAATH